MKRDVERRLAEIEAELKRIAPTPEDGSPEWISWTEDHEIDELERLYRREATDGPEAITQANVARVLSIQAAALARMLAGEPRAGDRPYSIFPR